MNLMFRFGTKVGSGTGVVRLVPLRKNAGKATDDSGKFRASMKLNRGHTPC